jgi:hypothetical protein
MPGASVSPPENTGGGSLASAMTLRATMKIVMDPMITADEGIVILGIFIFQDTDLLAKTPNHAPTAITVRRLHTACPMALK